MWIPEGLQVYEDWTDQEEELGLIKLVTDLFHEKEQDLETRPNGRSRILRFGYNNHGLFKEKIPVKILPVMARVESKSGSKFCHVTLNEYPTGHGIHRHLDRSYDKENKYESCTIPVAVLCLGSSCVLVFSECLDNKLSSVTYECRLPRRSLVILSGPARSQHPHEIPHGTNESVRHSIIFR